MSRGTRRATLAGTATGLQPLLDRLTSPGIGIAYTEFRRGNRALREVLMHCRGPNTRHFRGRIHIDEIKGWRLESGLGVLVHRVQCAASLVMRRGRRSRVIWSAGGWAEWEAECVAGYMVCQGIQARHKRHPPSLPTWVGVSELATAGIKVFLRVRLKRAASMLVDLKLTEEDKAA